MNVTLSNFKNVFFILTIHMIFFLARFARSFNFILTTYYCCFDTHPNAMVKLILHLKKLLASLARLNLYNGQ